MIAEIRELTDKPVRSSPTRTGTVTTCSGTFGAASLVKAEGRCLDIVMLML